MGQALVSKLVAIVVLMTVSLVAGLLPALLVGQFWCQCRQVAHSTTNIVSFLSCFGGGVFLATCLLDLIPDVRKSIEIALTYSSLQTEFPVADFIVAVGLFIILITEQTALTFKHKNDVIPHAHNHSDHNSETGPLLGHASGNRSRPTNSMSDSVNQITGRRVASDDAGVMKHDPGSTLAPSTENGSLPSPSRSDGSNRHSAHSNDQANGDSDDDCHALHSPSMLRSLLLLGALSLHSVFEGLAMGVQGKSSDVWTLFIAVVIHKSVLAFSLGVNLLKTRMGKGAMLRSLVLFSVMAPIGITIGIVITEEFSKNFSQSFANGTIQGLATGTFLYITFFEVLPHEMNTTKNRLLKVLAIILGFSLMTILVLLPTLFGW